ncbi:hypothetical protein [Massilia cavernae]|uniref:Lipoprotein n=1 Tax=Massilia cavernae TaxID=2320864 RepID=A0A418Y4C8_9BURK|nr:hypothetical protein [Massilia cavernae]RJG20521.1 hypothetical protein D3872_08260 [Massilia cavernae]
MKTPLIIAAAAILTGCATYPDTQYGYAQSGDPSQWRVVSVTPVPPGTGDRVAAASRDGSRVQYSSQPITTAPVYAAQPVYSQPSYYYPPVYAQPSYYYPPVSLSLGFVFGKHWSSGRHHHRGHHGRGRH